MPSTSWDRERAALRYELTKPSYARLLITLQRRAPVFQRFSGWPQVLDCMCRAKVVDPLTDLILRPILVMLKETDDQRCQVVLQAMFWPARLKILWQRPRWNENHRELWTDIEWALMSAVWKIDVQRNPSGIARRLIWDTFHYLHAYYSDLWRLRKRETPTDPFQARYLEHESRAGVWDNTDLQACTETCYQWLEKLTQAGVISPSDKDVIASTRLGDLPVSEYARVRGLDPDTVRKRRLRAERKIRRHEESRSRARHLRVLCGVDSGEGTVGRRAG